MPDIIALLHCIEPWVAARTLRQFSRIIPAVLAMSGWVTMLGISRWAGPDGSYRTVLPWATMFWVFFRTHLHQASDVYILASDVVVSKAVHHTHGLDRFFAGVYGRVVPGLAFFSLALISTQQRHCFPIRRRPSFLASAHLIVVAAGICSTSVRQTAQQNGSRGWWKSGEGAGTRCLRR